MTELCSTSFRVSRWFIVDGDSGFGYLHRMDVRSVADVSEIHTVTMFRTFVSREDE